MCISKRIKWILKKATAKNFFLHFFAIYSSSRHEKLERIFWLFQCSTTVCNYSLPNAIALEQTELILKLVQFIRLCHGGPCLKYYKSEMKKSRKYTPTLGSFFFTPKLCFNGGQHCCF